MKIITAIDVGSHSIKGITAKLEKTGRVEVLGISQSKSSGVRNGEIVQPEKTAQAVNIVKEELAKQSQTKIKNVFVSINGPHLYSQISQGLVSVSRANQRISKEDVQRVLKAAQAVKLPLNKIVLLSEPREFIIDNEGDIRNPIGLKGIRLEAKVNLICLFTPVLENLETAFSQAGLEIIEAIPSPLALSRAVLNAEQKELGCCLLEIGASCTSITVFEKNKILGFAILPIGSANITNDIAIGFRTEIATAENIKKNFACLKKSKKKKGKEKISLNNKEITFSKSLLNKIVDARINELIKETEKYLKKITNGQALPAGIILSGGGAEIKGLVEFIKEKYALPCRKSALADVDLKEFSEFQFAVCLGLIIYGLDEEEFCPLPTANRQNKLFSGLKEKLGRFFKNFLPND